MRVDVTAFHFRLFPGTIRDLQILSSWNTRCITHPANYRRGEMDYESHRSRLV